MSDNLVTQSSFSDNYAVLDQGRGCFASYLSKIQKFPMLTPEEEYRHGMNLFENNDSESAKVLIQSHLRLVVKMAGKYRNYGLPLVDLVSEGNIGLIQAVKKFDPKKGFRLSTYAMWWIKAYIQEYILKSWSLVKIGTTLAQKKLFFNLNKIKKKILAVDQNMLDDEQIDQIAQELDVSRSEVVNMDSRMTQGDVSINVPVAGDDDQREMSEILEANGPSQEEIVIYNQEQSHQRKLFEESFALLNDREKDILVKRQLSENSMTLEELSGVYGVSRERIRQIEENAIKKIKKNIFANSPK